MGKGGNRYFALDITKPAEVITEASAGKQVLWEFPPVGDTTTDMGYSYGKPIIAKTRAFNGEWLVMVGSDTTIRAAWVSCISSRPAPVPVRRVIVDGRGQSGNAVRSDTPGRLHPGLPQPTRGADICGRPPGQLLALRRVGPQRQSLAGGEVSTLRSTAPDDGSAQPVTTPPEIKIDVNNGIDRWVSWEPASCTTRPTSRIRSWRPSMPYATVRRRLRRRCPRLRSRATSGMLSLPALDSTNEFGLPNVPDNGLVSRPARGLAHRRSAAGSVRHHRIYRNQAADRSLPDGLAGDDMQDSMGPASRCSPANDDGTAPRRGRRCA